MSPVFSLTVIAYAVGVSGLCTVCAVAGRPRPAATTPALAIVQLSVVVQAVLDAVSVGRGQHGDGVATHLGYLLTSLIILPVTAAAVRLDPGRYGSAALAVGCVLLAVVSLRLHQTLGA